MSQASNDKHRSSQIEYSPAITNALDALVSRDRITQEDVRETLSGISKSDRMSLWILVQERVVQSFSGSLKQAWRVHGIYAAARTLVHGVLKYDSAPEDLMSMMTDRERLNFIEKELALAIGYKSPEVPPHYPITGMGHCWKG